MTDPSVSCPAPDTAETFDLAAVLESANEDRENLIAANRTVSRERDEALAEVERLRGVVERLTGIQRNGHMPRYLDARSRTVAAEAALDRVLALCDEQEHERAESLQQLRRFADVADVPAVLTTDEVRAAVAGGPS